MPEQCCLCAACLVPGGGILAATRPVVRPSVIFRPHNTYDISTIRYNTELLHLYLHILKWCKAKMLRTSGMKNELIIAFVVPNRHCHHVSECWFRKWCQKMAILDTRQMTMINDKCFIQVFCICINMRHVSWWTY